MNPTLIISGSVLQFGFYFIDFKLKTFSLNHEIENKAEIDEPEMEKSKLIMADWIELTGCSLLNQMN